jgi:hypothetical protein
MSKLSRYAGLPARRSPLAPRRVLHILVLAGVGFCFCLAQLSLKFSLSDLERETRLLQSEREDLQSRINRIKGDVARLEQGDRLVQHARDRGMVEFVVADVEHMSIDPEREHTFALARQRSGESEPPAPTDRAEIGRAIAMRLGFEQSVMARSE